jgi:GT2 family glycosyltransferase
MNSLDIVIVNHNSTDYLLSCLRSVYDALQELPAKIFVQDNASEDGVDRVNEMFPKAILSKNSYNMGFSKAANNAMKQSTAPYIVLLNPDTHVTHGFFECVLRYMEENPDVGIIGPKILNRDGSVQGSARSFPTLLTAFFGRNSLLTGWFPNSRLARQSIPTTGSDGVSGWKVVYFPQASIVHYVGGSSDKLVLRSVFEFHKSCYRFFDKYTKFPLSIVSPLVFWGIALRFFFVLLFHKMR